MKNFRSIALHLLLAGSVAGIPALAAEPTPAIPLAHELTAPDAEAWLDGFMPNTLKAAHTPGAVVVIVKDGQVLLEKGYGYADLKKQTAVDPKNTMFRPGSTSKLFTWTAVMQLVEKGQLNLDADVNTYLDFNIPPRNGKPITLRQIMVHRAGFEEAIKDLLTFDKPPKALADVLKSYIPPRFADPDTVSAYSNYGCALAGYIVQRVSGMSFEEYIEKNIFIPLGMNNSSFRQPLPPALLSKMATGYENTGKIGHGYEIVSLAPAGSLASTGDDMAKFMIAHLDQGTYNNAEILKPATAHLMHDSITRAFPDLNGNALGFYETNINGRRVLAHGGDLNYFHTDLWLFLNERVGVFISVNALGEDGKGEMIRDDMLADFSDRYFPKVEPVVKVSEAMAKEHARVMAGKYISTRRADSTFLSMAGLIAPTEIVANDDGSITTKTLLEPITYVEVQPYLWRQIGGGHDKLQATVRDGKVILWSTNTLAFGFAFEPPKTWLGIGAQQVFSVLAIGLLTLGGLFWVIGLIGRWKYRQPLTCKGKRALAYHLHGAAGFLPVISLGIWFAFLTAVESFNGSDPALFLIVAQVVALLSAVIGLVVTAWNLVLKRRENSKWVSVVWTLVCFLSFLFLTWIGLHYNLIGFYSLY